MRARDAAASSLRVPSTSVARVRLAAPGSEAAWMTASMPASASSIPSPVARSPSTRSPSEPGRRLKTRARWPCLRSSATTSRPRWPVPPVTRTFISHRARFGRDGLAEVRSEERHDAAPRVFGGVDLRLAALGREERVACVRIHLYVVLDLATSELAVEGAAGARREVLLGVRADDRAQARDGPERLWVR